MATGQLLSSLRSKLKAEIRDQQETNPTLDTEYNTLLSNKQVELASMWDWNFLKHDWDLSTTAGTRYFDIPTVETRGLTVAIDFDREVVVNRLYNTLFYPVSYGINIEDRNYLDGVNRSQDPVQKWQVVTNTNETANPNQIEVWPIPVSTQTLRFSGRRVLQTLASDSDKADLDDLLIVLGVASDILIMREQANAANTLKRFNDRLMLLKQGRPTEQSCHVFGKSRYPLYNEQVKLVAVK